MPSTVVEPIVAVVPAAALLFAGTNVDDMVVLGPLNVSRALGLVPLGLGVYRLILALRARGADTDAVPPVPGGLAAMVGLTVANGGDNVAAYVPVFRTLDGAALTVLLMVFAVGVAVWCVPGSWLVSHPRVTHLRTGGASGSSRRCSSRWAGT